jgi:hypothetical protein
MRISPKEEKAIKKMASAMCEADGIDLEPLSRMLEETAEPAVANALLAWQQRYPEARRQYFAHKAMIEALEEEK